MGLLELEWETGVVIGIGSVEAEERGVRLSANQKHARLRSLTLDDECLKDHPAGVITAFVDGYHCMSFSLKIRPIAQC